MVGKYVFIGDEYVGKMPMHWITQAHKADALYVAIVLYRLSAINKGGPFKFTNIECKRRGISRHTKYRALVALEKAGLIEVLERRNGANPIITIKQ